MLRSGCSDTRGCDFWEYRGGCFASCVVTPDPHHPLPNLLHLCPIVAPLETLRVVHTFSPLARTRDNTLAPSPTRAASHCCHSCFVSHLTPPTPIYKYAHKYSLVYMYIFIHIVPCTCVGPALWPLPAPVHGCLVFRLLRQHGVVLRARRGPRRSHSAASRSYRFSSSLTRSDTAL